jgi:hypothetical protein
MHRSFGHPIITAEESPKKDAMKKLATSAINVHTYVRRANAMKS